MILGHTGYSRYSGTATLLSGVVSTGAGSSESLQVTCSRFTVTVTWGGTSPTNTVVNLEGSIDGTNFGILGTSTVTATGTMFHVVDKPVNHIRGNYVSKSGGDGTTSVTMVVMAAE